MPFGEQHGEDQPDSLGFSFNHRLDRHADPVDRPSEILKHLVTFCVRSQYHVFSLEECSHGPGRDPRDSSAWFTEGTIQMASSMNARRRFGRFFPLAG